MSRAQEKLDRNVIYHLHSPLLLDFIKYHSFRAFFGLWSLSIMWLQIHLKSYKQNKKKVLWKVFFVILFFLECRFEAGGQIQKRSSIGEEQIKKSPSHHALLALWRFDSPLISSS